MTTAILTAYQTIKRINFGSETLDLWSCFFLNMNFFHTLMMCMTSVFSISLHPEHIFTNITLIREILCVFKLQDDFSSFSHIFTLIILLTFVNVRVLSKDSHVPEHIFTNFTLISYNLSVVFFDYIKPLIILRNLHGMQEF